MDIQQQSPLLKTDKLKQGQAQTKHAEAQNFNTVLEQIHKNVAPQVIAPDAMAKTKFKEKKQGVTAVTEEDLDEKEVEDNIHTTVQKLKKKLKALAELERRVLGLK